MKDDKFQSVIRTTTPKNPPSRGFSTPMNPLNSSPAAGSPGTMSDSSLRRVFIALGSNMGDRISMIETACRRMEERGIQIQRTSSLFETAPMYVIEQGEFVNGVCEVSTIDYPDSSKRSFSTQTALIPIAGYHKHGSDRIAGYPPKHRERYGEAKSNRQRTPCHRP